MGVGFITSLDGEMRLHCRDFLHGDALSLRSNAADAKLANLLQEVRLLSTGVFNGPLCRRPLQFRRAGFRYPEK